MPKSCLDCSTPITSRAFRCRPCGHKSKYSNILDRLKRYTHITDSCWLWIGQENGTGYGQVGIGGKSDYVHRVSYKFHFGEIPKGLSVLHICDVRNCWRPDHLKLGTQRENIQDAIAKGRHVFGEKQGQHKLVTHNVRRMKKLYNAKEFGCTTLARMFGVSEATAYRIVKGQSWKHIV